MRISEPVELNPSQRECAQHVWMVQGTGRDVAEEVYTCVRCGASWRREVRFRCEKLNGKAEVAWPTWADIIEEP